MKAKLFNLVMPMAVIALGLAGAFSTQAMSKTGNKSGAVQGYSHFSVANPCRAEIMCANTGVLACTANGFNLYAKANPSSSSDCAIPLTRN